MELGFKDLISPITVEDFHRNYWDVKFCHLAGQSDRFSRLLRNCGTLLQDPPLGSARESTFEYGKHCILCVPAIPR